MLSTDEFGSAAVMRRPPPGVLSGSLLLVAGAATVVAPAVVSNSTIFLYNPATGETISDLTITITDGVGFTLKSSNPLDTRTVAWFIKQPGA